jgi:hypothetical protein
LFGAHVKPALEQRAHSRSVGVHADDMGLLRSAPETPLKLPSDLID